MHNGLDGLEILRGGLERCGRIDAGEVDAVEDVAGFVEEGGGVVETGRGMPGAGDEDEFWFGHAEAWEVVCVISWTWES